MDYREVKFSILNTDQRLRVLLAELQERYNASHKIRERSAHFTLWLSGMAIGLGWLLITQTALTLSQRIALTLFIFALFGGAVYFIIALHKGFLKNREAMIKIEKALGLYEPGFYLPETPLLPEEYKRPKRKWSNHFSTLYIWLIIVGLSLLILTWMSPCPLKTNPSYIKKVEQTEKGGNYNGKFTQ